MAYEYKGIEYMRRKLARKRTRGLKRYAFYEMKNITLDMGISTPPALRAWASSLSWCANAVDILADRLMFREFKNDFLDMNGIFRKNNPDVLFDSAILGALITACDFVRILRKEDGQPGLEVIDGTNATGEIDETTGLLKEGYAVLSRDEAKRPVLEAWFTSTETLYFLGGKHYRTDTHPAGAPLLVPIIYQPDSMRPFGHSRISRACMDHTESAIRTIKRSEVSAEFYSFPQKWVTGLAQDAELSEKWQATMSSFLMMTKDEEGESPKFGQFTQGSMEPHLAQLRMFAALFAGATKLTLDDMGFPSDNPSSQEAIKAAHENLKIRAEKAQRTFGSGFLNVGLLAASLRDDFTYSRDILGDVKPMWRPVFPYDPTSLNALGDGIIKINQAVPGFITAETLYDMTGIEPGGSV